VPVKFNDIAAVVATRDYTAARSWYSRVIGREPDLEPVDEVAAWLQLVVDPDRAGKSMVRIGVVDLAAQIAELNDAGIATGESVVIADMVKVVDIADPDGNEVSFVEEMTPTEP